jgi:excisionase family DNA binding protein
VIDIDHVCELLGVSRTWVEKTIRAHKTFPRPFRIGARRHIKVSDLQLWVDQKARAA